MDDMQELAARRQRDQEAAAAAQRDLLAQAADVQKIKRYVNETLGTSVPWDGAVGRIAAKGGLTREQAEFNYGNSLRHHGVIDPAYVTQHVYTNETRLDPFIGDPDPGKLGREYMRIEQEANSYGSPRTGTPRWRDHNSQAVRDYDWSRPSQDSMNRIDALSDAEFSQAWDAHQKSRPRRW